MSVKAKKTFYGKSRQRRKKGNKKRKEKSLLREIFILMKKCCFFLVLFASYSVLKFTIDKCNFIHPTFENINQSNHRMTINLHMSKRNDEIKSHANRNRSLHRPIVINIDKYIQGPIIKVNRESMLSLKEVYSNHFLI
jgi:heme/copper-type cytochrome/quinol oxidase subunit 3